MAKSEFCKRLNKWAFYVKKIISAAICSVIATFDYVCSTEKINNQFLFDVCITLRIKMNGVQHSISIQRMLPSYFLHDRTTPNSLSVECIHDIPLYPVLVVYTLAMEQL